MNDPRPGGPAPGSAPGAKPGAMPGSATGAALGSAPGPAPGEDAAAGTAPAPPEHRSARRRRRRGRGRGLVALFPGLLTTGNLAAGFFSITRSAEGQYEVAAYGILVAVLFDIADGRVARLARAASRFGAAYDSLADVISFGVAPAFLAYTAGGLTALGWTGWVLALLYVLCTALRLARFDVRPGRYRGRFDGLAAPAAAVMVSSSAWFAGFMQGGGLFLPVSPVLVGIGLVLLAVLMVSVIPYYSFKELPQHGSFRSAVLMVFAAVFVLSKPPLTFFLSSIVYVASGPVAWLWRRRTGRTLEEALPPALADATPAPPGVQR